MNDPEYLRHNHVKTSQDIRQVNVYTIIWYKIKKNESV